MVRAPVPRSNVMCRHVPAPFWRPVRPARTCFELTAVHFGGCWPFLSDDGRPARMPGGERGASVCRHRVGTNGQRPPDGPP